MKNYFLYKNKVISHTLLHPKGDKLALQVETSPKAKFK